MSIDISKEDFAELLRERAKAGDPEFQFRVSECYLYGYGGIEKNDTEYVKWLKLAAKNGHAGGQNELGVVYYNGCNGVDKDLKEAFRLQKLSAEQGYAVGQFSLAYCYQYGIGVMLDNDKAIELYCASAFHGYWNASRQLGDIYFAGRGVNRDLNKAKWYYQKALDDVDFKEKPALEIEKISIYERMEKVNNKLAEAEKAARMAARTEVFISYTHADEKYIKELNLFLKSLELDYGITIWYDGAIKTGDEWKEEIRKHMLLAKVAILMVSQAFLVSDFVRNKELPELLQAAKDEGATIMWVSVRDSTVKTTHISSKSGLKICIADYQAVYDPKKPLIEMTDHERDKVYKKLVEDIETCFGIEKNE